MYRIKLNGADVEKVAQLIGGTLIMENVTDGIATIAGGDVSKLCIDGLNKATSPNMVEAQSW